MRTPLVFAAALVAACSAPPGPIDSGSPDSGRVPFDGGPRQIFRVPSLTAVRPATASSGGPALVLTLTGGFDSDAVATWVKEVWPAVELPRGSRTRGSSSKTRPASH